MKKNWMLFLILTLLLSSCKSKDDDLLEGRVYIKSLDKKDVSQIEEYIEGKKTQEESNEKEETSEKKDFDMLQAPLIFEDTIFMGDSIVEYLSALNIVRESSVIAAKGETVDKAANKLDVLENMNPKNIVLLYGLNDSLSYSPEHYELKYDYIIKEIKSKLPNSKILIQEPLDVLESKLSKESTASNKKLADMRKVAERVARANDVEYVKINYLLEDDKLYEEDGIHFVYDFYVKWLSILSEEIK